MKEVHFSDNPVFLESENIVIIYEEQGPGIVGTARYNTYRDFEGNISIQSSAFRQLDHFTGKLTDYNYVLYSFDHNEYGVGRLSLAAVNNELVSFNRYINNDAGRFWFAVFEGKLDIGNLILTDDSTINHGLISRNINNIKSKGIRNIALMGNSGEGRLKVYVDGYNKVVTLDELGGLISGKLPVNPSDFAYITLHNYNNTITKAYNAGALHLGKGKIGTTYKFDGVLSHGEDKYAGKPVLSSSRMLSIATNADGNIVFTYGVNEDREDRLSVKERTFLANGLLYSELHIGKPLRDAGLRLTIIRSLSWGQQVTKLAG